MCTSVITLVSFPDPITHARNESAMGTLQVLSWSCAPSRDRTCSNTNNHMIAELAKPRISATVPRPFPPSGSGVWGGDRGIISHKAQHGVSRSKPPSTN